VRQAAADEDRPALVRLAREIDVSKQPPAALLLLRDNLDDVEEFAAEVDLLRRGQRQYPTDFWTTEHLSQQD
jgi:hypothetical protein